MKYWEIIADRLSEAGWSLGWISAVDFEGRTMWIADAHRGNGKRFIVHADDKLSAFVQLEREALTVTDHAIDYAQNRACFRSGEIRVLDLRGNVEPIIAFDEPNRKL